MIRSIVLLPQPLGPTTPTNSPSAIVNDTSSSASVPVRYRFERPSTAIATTAPAFGKKERAPRLSFGVLPRADR